MEKHRDSFSVNTHLLLSMTACVKCCLLAFGMFASLIATGGRMMIMEAKMECNVNAPYY
jgi:hypothetical protein